jgi:universal stress protein A
MKTKTKIAGGAAKTISGANARPISSSQVDTASGAPRLQLQSILVPTDFSKPSLKALHYAAALAAQFGAKLTLLTVVEPIGATPDFAYNPLVLDNEAVRATAEEQLQRLLKRQAIDVALVQRTLVRQGVPFNEISGAASRLKADLIVIATHGYTGLKHVFLGSTAERVVRHAPCPVLVVRENEREFIAK